MSHWRAFSDGAGNHLPASPPGETDCLPGGGRLRTSAFQNRNSPRLSWRDSEPLHLGIRSAALAVAQSAHLTPFVGHPRLFANKRTQPVSNENAGLLEYQMNAAQNRAAPRRLVAWSPRRRPQRDELAPLRGRAPHCLGPSSDTDRHAGSSHRVTPARSR
jgi:hypothetical protein